MKTAWKLAFVAALAVCLASLSFAAAQSKKTPPAKPLDLNTATVEELQQLPTVGPTAAKAIVRFREKSGPFRKVEDLLAVPGFTKKRLAKIRPYITVVPPTPKPQRRASARFSIFAFRFSSV
ncbi:MAG: helix-hairpin-helix domain-containing protein [Acidobacteria bacterium]|nr:helix-hairpin-helix domain-containing protein [Acidobacteriota bacterium]